MHCVVWHFFCKSFRRHKYSILSEPLATLTCVVLFQANTFSVLFYSASFHWRLFESYSLVFLTCMQYTAHLDWFWQSRSCFHWITHLMHTHTHAHNMTYLYRQETRCLLLELSRLSVKMNKVRKLDRNQLNRLCKLTAHSQSALPAQIAALTGSHCCRIAFRPPIWRVLRRNAYVRKRGFAESPCLAHFKLSPARGIEAEMWHRTGN